MKRVYVFVEGQTDADLLRRVLPPELTQGAEFVPAGGSSGIPSLARSFLVRRRAPVAVLMDSDSLDPAVIEESRQSMEELIRAAAGSIPVKVVVAVPEIEAWFFAAPESIERVLGTKVPEEWVALGKRDPSGVLDLLAKHASHQWDTNRAIGALDAHDVERIRAIPAVSELSNFLRDAELVLAAEEVFYSGEGDKKVPRGAIPAMERVGMSGSMLYRSALRRGEEA
jgi:hypothetical protein